MNGREPSVIVFTLRSRSKMISPLYPIQVSEEAVSISVVLVN